MKPKYYFSLLFLLFTSLLIGSCTLKKESKENSQLVMKRTTKAERIKFKDNLYENIINKNIFLPLNDSTEKNYQKAFWGIELALDSADAAEQAIKRSLQAFPVRSPQFQQDALEVAYTVFPNSFYNEITPISQNTNDPKLFAMSISYLIRDKNNFHSRDFYFNLLKRKFSDWQNEPVLVPLGKYLQTPEIDYLSTRPSLVDLLSHNYGKDKTIIFSIQRSDRDYTGLAIIRKPDGKFVRDANGTIFNIPQLARAITNLPSNITNGNTPQGILSIQGVDNSKNVFIGPTTNIQLVLPFESNPKTFFHDDKIVDTMMTKEMYSNLLPGPWKNYFPIWESFYAGKAGRTEIISHGTTTNPEFYEGKPYYPNTPTLGCLSAKEIWSTKDGTRIESDQQALADAFLESGSKSGYIIVVDIDNKKQPVVIDNVIMDILKAEQNISQKKVNK